MGEFDSKPDREDQTDFSARHSGRGCPVYAILRPASSGLPLSRVGVTANLKLGCLLRSRGQLRGISQKQSMDSVPKVASDFVMPRLW